MNIQSQLKMIEKRVSEIKNIGKVRFFDSQEEYEQAYKNDLFGVNDICFIDDIPKE